MVLKMGIQGQYWPAQLVALGGAAAEAVRTLQIRYFSQEDGTLSMELGW
jgi:hypothetical protein